MKELLKQKKLTQAKISKELVKFGIYKYQQDISDYLSGKRLPDIKTAFYLSKVLGVSLDEFAELLGVSNE